MVFRGIKRNDTWKVVEKALTEPLQKKISVEEFNRADKDGRRSLLKDGFARAVLQASGGQLKEMYRCFNVDHEDKTPSMFFDIQHGHGHFHCFGCQDVGKNYDGFNAIEDYFGLDKFKDCYDKAVELFVDGAEQVVAPTPNLPLPVAMYKATKNQYYTPIKQDGDGIDYLKSRGISPEIAERNAVMTWEYKSAYYYMVFINDNGSAVRRFLYYSDPVIETNAVDRPNTWWNSKGDSGFFGNERAIMSATPRNEPIFVVESAIDALSAQELGFKAVGLNTCKKCGKLLREYPYPKYIVLMDNDVEGRNTATNVKDSGYFIVDYGMETDWPFLSKHKDLNECLVVDRAQTKLELQKIVATANNFYKEKGVV